MTAADAIRRWANDPNLFKREVLNFEPDAWQVEVGDALVTHDRVAMAASKGPGKTAELAADVWWYLVTRPHPKVLCTSITGDNLRDGLWTELAKWQAKSEFLKAAFTWTAERIFANDHPKTWWASARQWSKTADPTRQSETLAGVHADHIMFVIDEAGGVPDAVMAAAEAGLANADPTQGREAKLLIAGNTTQTSGPLYRACTKERSLWYVKHINGDPDDPKRAPRVSVKWAREQIEKYGRDSAYVLVNVFGQFPPGQSDALISVHTATKASERIAPTGSWEAHPKVMGVDPAFKGDDRTCFAYRQGPVAFPIESFRELDQMRVAGLIVQRMQTFKPDMVFVDVTGGYGGGVVARLHELGYHNVVGVNFATKAPDATSKNMRVFMWDQMAQWLEADGCTPDDAELIAELTAPTYWMGSDGRKCLLSKDDLKAEGHPSPDKADALALTFAAPVKIKTDLERFQATQRAKGWDYDPREIGAA